MKYLPGVVDCKYYCEYKLVVYFDDGKISIVDLKPYLKFNIFKPLKDLRFFKRVKAKDHTIVWPHNIDFAPEILYEIGVDITPKPAKAKRKAA